MLDFRSCDIWEHFYMHRWIDHTQKHGIRHQDHLSRLNNTKDLLVFNFGYFGWRPYWIRPKKVPSRFLPPGILIDLVNRPPKGNDYEGFKTIPIFSRSNPIFMRLQPHSSKRACWTSVPKPNTTKCEPKTTKCEPNTTKCEPNTTKCEPSTNKCEPNTTKCEPNTTKCKPNTTKCEPSTTKCEPNTTTCEPCAQLLGCAPISLCEWGITSCAHKWGQYTPALITTHLIHKDAIKFLFCSRVLHRWEFFRKTLNRAKNFSKSSGNPIFGQIFGHQRAENEARNTKMYGGQETHPIRVNARNDMNRTNSFFQKFWKPHFWPNIWPPEGQQGKSEGFESCDQPIVRKRPIWVKIGDVLSYVTLKFDGWLWKTIGHLSFAVSSFVQHFIAIGEFKLELLSGNAQFGSNSTILRAVWPWNLADDLEKQ